MIHVQKKVSAIITTYKRPPEILLRAVNSVLNQTYKDIELIIVDDSPDSYEFREDIKRMIESLEGNIKYIQHEVNKGACAARNTGIKNSTGDYIAFLDDDDEWVDIKIEKMIEKMDSSKIGLVYCGYLVVNETKNTVTEHMCRKISGYLFDELMHRNFVGSTSFPLIRRECFDKVGMFDEEQLALQDYELWVRIAKEYELDYVDLPLVKFYEHNDVRITTNPKNRIQGNERFNRIHKEYLKKHPKVNAYRQHRLVLPYARNKQYFKSAWQLLKGIAYDPLSFKGNINMIKGFMAVLLKEPKCVGKVKNNE